MLHFLSVFGGLDFFCLFQVLQEVEDLIKVKKKVKNPCMFLEAHL